MEKSQEILVKICQVCTKKQAKQLKEKDEQISKQRKCVSEKIELKNNISKPIKVEPLPLQNKEL